MYNYNASLQQLVNLMYVLYLMHHVFLKLLLFIFNSHYESYTILTSLQMWRKISLLLKKALQNDEI